MQENFKLCRKIVRMLDLLRSQVAVLLRFRQFSLPINGDIEKIYHQVQVPAKSQYALRFLYPAPGINKPIKVFQMTRHVFVAVSSPTTCMNFYA